MTQALALDASIMGHTYVNAMVRGTKGQQRLTNVLVDTGATYTVLPSDLVERVEAVKSPWVVDLELGDKRKIKAAVYLAEIEINGRKGPAKIAAFKDATPVLGVDILETIGLRVNPRKGVLEAMRGNYILFV